MYCPHCGKELPAVTDPTQRKLTCTACGHEVDLAIRMQMERTRQVFSTRKGTEEPQQDELIGRTLGDGRYRIDSSLGRGGMGTVYRSTQLSLGREVAIKVLSPQLAADEKFIRRFRREAVTLATFNHPHIVTIYDTGSEAGLDYIVMAYVAGPDGKPLSLRQVMATSPLERDFALRVIAQTCSGLQYAHDKGIIHRDIKPGNILLDARGDVHIADFGIARAASGLVGDMTLTAPDVVIGTLKYMAPEQKLDATRGDARSDLYALGVVFYEMLTGQLPEGRFELPSEIRKDLDRRIDRIVERTLHRAVERRYQTAAEMVRDLSTFTVARDATLPLFPSQQTQLADVKTSRSLAGIPEPVKGKARRFSPWMYGTAGGLIVLALLIGGQWYRSQQPAEEARQQPAVEQEAAGAKVQQPEAAQQGTQAEAGRAEEAPVPQEQVAEQPPQEQEIQQQAKIEQPRPEEEVRKEAEERKKAEAAQQVARLLDDAKKQRAAERLTTPAGDNALETYQKVLRVVPGHNEALGGIKELKEQYKQWAEAAKQQGDWAKAQARYETALTIDPQDETLAAALQQVKEARKGAEALAGWYETTSSTPVLKEPRKDAVVISTLSPKKRVYVAGAAGDYLRIEPVRGNPPGYISRGDAVPAQPESTGGEQQVVLTKPGAGTEQQPTEEETRQEETGHNLEDAIIGKWETAGTGIATLEFFKDGTVIIVDKLKGVERRGNYKFIDDNRFRLEVGGAVTLLFAAISENSLELISPDGSSRPGFYKRVKSQPDTRSEHTKAGEVEQLMTRADSFVRMRQYNQAIADYTRAIQLDPRNAMVYNNRGHAYTQQRQYDQAIADYTHAIQLDPRNAIAYSNRGHAYSKQRQYDQAIADFNRSIEFSSLYGEFVDPEGDLFKDSLWVVYHGRGYAYASLGRDDQAIADFTRAIQLNPRNAIAYVNRGYSYARKRLYDQARGDFQRACDLGHGDSCRALRDQFRR